MSTEVISQYLGQHTDFVELPGSEAWLAAEGFVSVPRRLLIHVLSTGTVALHDAVGDRELEDTLGQLIWEFGLSIGELFYRAGIEPQQTSGDGDDASDDRVLN
jgi:hypothetical protein